MVVVTILDAGKITPSNACEWNPAKSRAAYSDEIGHAKSDLIVGANGQWRLCHSCAKFDEFKRFRVRIPVRFKQ